MPRVRVCARVHECVPLSLCLRMCMCVSVYVGLRRSNAGMCVSHSVCRQRVCQSVCAPRRKGKKKKKEKKSAVPCRTGSYIIRRCTRRQRLTAVDSVMREQTRTRTQSYSTSASSCVFWPFHHHKEAAIRKMTHSHSERGSVGPSGHSATACSLYTWPVARFFTPTAPVPFSFSRGNHVCYHDNKGC